LLKFTENDMTERIVHVCDVLPGWKFCVRSLLSQGGPRDAAVNFDKYQILQRHRAVSLPQHGFLV